MMLSRFVAVLGLTIFGPPLAALAQSDTPDDLCGWVLAEAGLDQWRGAHSGDRFLENETGLLDLYFGKVESDGRYGDFYSQQGQPALKALDFHTGSSQRLAGGCVRLDGNIGSDETEVERRTYVVRRDGIEFPVSMFVYEDDAPRLSDGTNVKVKVANLDLVPGSGPPASSDLLSRFGLSAYVGRLIDTTITGSVDTEGNLVGNGQHVWLAADIGKGDQLIGVVCRPDCKSLLSKTRSTPEFRPTTAPPPVVVPPPPIPPAAPDFTGVKLDLLNEYLVAFGQVDLGAKMNGSSDNDRTVLDVTLEDLASSDPARRQTALKALLDSGIIAELKPGEWQVDGFEKLFRIVLRRTGAERLTRVTVQLKPEYGRELLGNCVPSLEISHPSYAPLLLDFQLPPSATPGLAYDRYSVKLDQGEPILSEPPDSLSLRVFLKENPDATCRLIWKDRFPQIAYRIPAFSDIPADGSFSLSDDGVATFNSVVFTSTRPPLHLVLFNKTGPVDANGEATDPDVYPRWNAPDDRADFAEAMSILANAAFGALNAKSGGVFQVLADPHPASKDFGSAETFYEEQMKDAWPELRPGGFGGESLKHALQGSSPDLGLPPLFVVIGRTGLPVGTDYCAEVPAAGVVATDGSILIDFVPQEFVEYLPQEVQDSIDNSTVSSELAKAIKGFPAATCPAKEGSTLVHWVLLPDGKRTSSWRPDLETVASYIFGVVK